MNSQEFNEIKDFVLFGEGVSNFEYVASGKDGDVYRRNDKAIKIFKADGYSNSDGKKLHMLDRSIYYPKVFAFEEQFMVSEFIEGETLYQLDGKNGAKILTQHAEDLQQAIFDARLVGLLANDLHLNNIMLTEKGDIRIVDVGRFDSLDNHQCRGIFDFIFSHSHSHSHGHRRKHSIFTSGSSDRRHRHGHSYSSSNHRHHHHGHSHSSSDHRHHHHGHSHSSSHHRHRRHSHSFSFGSFFSS